MRRRCRAAAMDDTSLTVALAGAFVTAFIAGGAIVLFLFGRFARHADFVGLTNSVLELTKELKQHQLRTEHEFLTKRTFEIVSGEQKAEVLRTREELSKRLTRLEERIIGAIKNGRSGDAP